MHKPIKGAFNNILAAIAAGTAKGKLAADKPVKRPVKSSRSPRAKP